LIFGIPDDLRGDIWKLICNTKETRQNYSDDLYSNLISLRNEEDEFCIGKDLPRTLTYIKSFSLDPDSGKNKLYNVLKAYSSYDIEIGYCQGINYLAAMLLTHIDDE
jgi:hypothetical protein